MTGCATACASTATRRCSRCTSAPARPVSAARPSAGSCSGPTPCPRATTTPTTGGPCGCALSFGDEPTPHTCPACLGRPGALPVANARAVQDALLIGLALGCELAARSIFPRTNYFSPDLPKGYQISQYDQPLCRGGHL